MTAAPHLSSAFALLSSGSPQDASASFQGMRLDLCLRKPEQERLQTTIPTSRAKVSALLGPQGVDFTELAQPI